MSTPQELRPPERLESVRLVLRRPTAADAAAVFSYAGDPQVTRWLDWPTHASPADSATAIAAYLAALASGEQSYWVIERRRDARVIGGIAARVAVPDADLGFVLARPAWGQGLATEAGQLVLDWLSGLAAVERIVAANATDNPASGRVLEKLGFTRAGVSKAFLQCPNAGPTRRDAWIWSLRKPAA